MVIVVMGVAGAGKTTVGRRLADQLGWPFQDADDLHSPASVERMRSGVPLTEEQRGPWLGALATLIGNHLREDRSLVLACSALSRSHRAALLAESREPDDIHLVHLRMGADRLAERLARRTGHFFPPDLLATQLAALEEPESDTGIPVLSLDAGPPVDELVAMIREALDL